MSSNAPEGGAGHGQMGASQQPQAPAGQQGLPGGLFPGLPNLPLGTVQLPALTPGGTLKINLGQSASTPAAAPGGEAAPRGRQKTAGRGQKPAQQPSGEAQDGTTGRKRPQKKTPEQVAALEHAFEVNPTPTGDEYREIAEQSGLTQAQVEHWFGHRRSKERKKLRESAEVSGVGLGSSMPSMGVMSGHAAPALEGVDLATLIEEASKHLFPEGLRPDAPPLVVDPFGFDPLPCMEEGPKKVVKRKAPAMTQETAAEKKLRLEEARVTRELEKLKQKEEIMAGEGAGEGEEAEARAQALADLKAKIAEWEQKAAQVREKREEAEERKAKAEEARLKKLQEKEQEKLMREMEKEQTRLRKEQEKERNRLAREAARKRTNNEKKHAKETEKAQKDVLRKLDQRRAKVMGDGVVEDTVLEWEAAMGPAIDRAAVSAGVAPAKLRNVLREFLVLGEDSSLSHTLKYLASPASATLPGGIPIPEPSQEEKRLGAAANDVLRQPSPATPEFPPKSLQLGPAWTADMCRCLDDVLEVHGIAHTFADLLGVWPFTVSELATAFREGQRSRLLAEIFTSLLQLIQADMEVAQSTLAVGGAVQGQSLGDKAALQAASRMLNEAWAWGLDNEAWRAHLNPLTWPEVLRQFAVTLGWGARRKRSVKQIAAGHVAEKLEHPTIPGLIMELPQEIAPGTVKYAVWHVLATVNAMGLRVEDILDRIHEMKIKEIGGRTPKITVAGACREGLQQGIFFKVKPGVFALKDVVEHTRGKPTEHGAGSKIKCGACHHCLNPSHKKACLNPTYINRREEEERAEEEELRLQNLKKDWAEKLMRMEYDDLPLEERVAACLDLMHACLEMPCMRNFLSQRTEAQEAAASALIEAQKQDRAKKTQRHMYVQMLNTYIKSLKLQLDNNSFMPPSQPHPPEIAMILGHDGTEPADSVDEGEQDARPAGPRPMTVEDRDAVSNDLVLLRQELERVETEEKEAEAAAVERDRVLVEAHKRYTVRGEPLGTDRRHNRYWAFDRGMGRKALVIELAGGTQWLLISTRAQFRGLLGMLRKDGLREAHLREALEGAAGELEEGMGEGAGDAPGAMGLCEKGTTDDDLNAFLEDRIDCHAPDAGRSRMDGATTKDPDQRRAEAAGMDAPDASAGLVLSVCFGRVKQDLLAVGTSLGSSGALDSVDVAAWGARVKTAKTPMDLRHCLGELEDALRLSRVHEGFAVGPRLRLVFGAWLETAGQFATMERSQEGWVGIPMEEVIVEDLEWAADIGCSRCQFSARGCRTCLFRIIESCYEKDQEIPPMIADLAQRFRPWPEPPAAAVTEEEHKARAEDAERRRVEKEHEDRQREQSEAKPLAWLPPTLSAVAFRLYGLDANVAYKEGAKPARESLPNYKYIIWPCQQLPPPINGSPSAALVGPESGCHWDLPRPYITEAEEAEAEAAAREAERRQKQEEERKERERKQKKKGSGGASGMPKKITLKNVSGKASKPPPEPEPKLAVEDLEDILSEDEEPEKEEVASEYNASDDDDLEMSEDD